MEDVITSFIFQGMSLRFKVDIHSFLFIDFRFVNQILFKLPSVHGDFKTYCLEILYSRVEQIPNLFTELRTKGLKDILTHR